MCYLNGEYLDSKLSKEEYDIEQLTTDTVCFGEKEVSLSDSNIFIEKELNQSQNVVIEEKEDYEMQWNWKIPITDAKYHIYFVETDFVVNHHLWYLQLYLVLQAW